MGEGTDACGVLMEKSEERDHWEDGDVDGKIILKCILKRFWVMTNLMHSFLMYLFYACTCFEQQVLIIRRAKLY
jgi:hypothetical protein